MRRNDWGFKVTGNVRCTELEWDLGVKDEKPLAQIRKKQRYTTGDEDKNIYERTDTGRLRRLRPRELRGRSSEDLHKYFHWLENGRIERVFESSASFCEELASRAFELEITKSTSDGTESKAAQNKASVKPQEARVARGGRPPGVAIFGEKVQELRQDSSQRTFARVTKLSIDVIQRAERGKATERTIKRLCRYAQLKRIPLTAESLKKNTTLKTAKT